MLIIKVNCYSWYKKSSLLIQICSHILGYNVRNSSNYYIFPHLFSTVGLQMTKVGLLNIKKGPLPQQKVTLHWYKITSVIN